MRPYYRLFFCLLFLLGAGCAGKHSPKAPGSVDPFVCGAISVPPFAWQAAEDTLWLESGRAGDGASGPTGDGVAKMMADALGSAGVAAGYHEEDSGLDTKGLRAAALARGERCLLLGRVEVWRERIGSNWSVSRSATVVFKVVLVDAASGAVMWKGAFHEEQKPLSENLLAITRFLSRGGRWVEAETLCRSGCLRLARSMVGAASGKK